MRKFLICWPAMPFLRALITFIPGIISYPYIPPLVFIPAFAASTIFLCTLGSLSVRLRFRFRLIPGIAMLAMLFCLGNISMFIYDIRTKPGFMGPQPKPPLIAIISSEPKKGKAGYSFELDAWMGQDNGKWRHMDGRIYGRNRNNIFKVGDTVLVLISPELLSPEKIRSSSFLIFLKRRNITHTIDGYKTELKVIGKKESENLVIQIRQWVLKVMDSCFKNSNERALAKALLVGSRIDLDPDLTAAYTNTGVVHVIAISGMHLALIYALLSSFLKPLSHKRTRLIRTILIVISLWLFSLVCGASPSVIRSAVMFSFILVGEAISRENQIGNTLAGSAFLLLFIQPVLLWDIGFQLSYAAVASLVIYNKSLNGILQPENGLLVQGWNIISTTISAQILTTPIAIFHFQQFPLIFLLSNLVAVPLSGFILILLFVVCLLYPLSMSGPIAKLTAVLMDFMNDRIVALNDVSFSTVRNICLTEYDTLNIYILLIALTLWRRSKK